MKSDVDVQSESSIIMTRVFDAPRDAVSIDPDNAIILTNHDKVEDLTHGFAIAKYGVNFIVNPQETASVTFVADKAGVLARITGILAENDISIDAVLQRESADGENQTDLIILTHDTVERRMKKALAQMQALPTVLAPIVRIRKEELN